MKLDQGLLQCPRLVARNQPHRVVRPPIRMPAPTVDRDNSRVLQSTGNLRLAQKPLPQLGIVPPPGQNLLEGDHPIHLGVVRHRDLPHAPRSQWPQDLDGSRRPAHRVKRAGQFPLQLGLQLGQGPADLAPHWRRDPRGRSLHPRLAPRSPFGLEAITRPHDRPVHIQ